MPELPEVETIRLGLKKAIVGKTIVGVDVRVPKLFHGDKKEIIGKKIKNIDRRAKQIIIDVEGNNDLLIHLKMTGQLIFDDGKSRVAGGHPSVDWVAKLPNSTTHIIFDFSDGSKLFFNDLRKFGWVKIFDSKKLKGKLANELGVEPFDKEFTTSRLEKIIKSKSRWNIKKVLTDQSLISGIGNIYADESLYWAGVLPTRLAAKISDEEIVKLRDSIIKSLEIGLKYGGSSENTYFKIDGTKGQAQEHFQVYAQDGKECKRCEGGVKKIKLNGRGTHFCPKCQK
jgi:formamidopyrimidine-DNA glycosylase